jgi:hypothetical protein
MKYEIRLELHQIAGDETFIEGLASEALFVCEDRPGATLQDQQANLELVDRLYQQILAAVKEGVSMAKRRANTPGK